MSRMIGFAGNAGERKMIVQEDQFDDSTACAKCGYAQHFGYICTACDKVHCSDCVAFEAHNCATYFAQRDAADDARRQHAPKNPTRFSVCSFAGCSERLMADMRCYYCSGVFCSAHKLETDHPCPKAPHTAPAPTAASPPAKATKALPHPLPLQENLHVDDRFVLHVVLPPVEHAAPEAQLEAVPDRNPLQVLVHKKWGTGRAAAELSKRLGWAGAGKVPRRFVFVSAKAEGDAALRPLPTISSFDELRRAGRLERGAAVVLLPQDLYDALRKKGAEVLQQRAPSAGLPQPCKAHPHSSLWDVFAAKMVSVSA